MRQWGIPGPWGAGKESRWEVVCFLKEGDTHRCLWNLPANRSIFKQSKFCSEPGGMPPRPEGSVPWGPCEAQSQLCTHLSGCTFTWGFSGHLKGPGANQAGWGQSLHCGKQWHQQAGKGRMHFTWFPQRRGSQILTEAHTPCPPGSYLLHCSQWFIWQGRKPILDIQGKLWTSLYILPASQKCVLQPIVKWP